MSVYFTNNQYLKTAEEDFEAAELLYGHNYYDQIGTLLSVAMTKYLKAIIESIVPNDESTAYFITEDKIELLRTVKQFKPDILVSEAECRWIDNVYGKANCTDGIHSIMPKQTIVDAFRIVANLRKYARECDKEGLSGGRYFLANLFKKHNGEE